MDDVERFWTFSRPRSQARRRPPRVEGERKAALHPLGPQRERGFANPGTPPRPIAIDGPPGVEIATPALDRLGLGLGDPGLPGAAGVVLEDGAAVISPGRRSTRPGTSIVGAQPAAFRPRAAASSVVSSVVVSPRSAGWTSAATIASVSRSTACSGL
jgi:hypothetical protein